MRGVGPRGALAVVTACAVLRVAVACSNDYAEREAGDDPDSSTSADAPVSDAPAGDSGPTPDAVSACPVHFMPQEGTYAYAHIFSGDELTVNGTAIATQPFDNPYFGTIVHEGNGCFRFNVYFANGSTGRHDHSWKFCNACDRSAPSLDVVEETDRFEIESPKTAQVSRSACTSPNPYLATDVAPDAALTQGACTGQSTGTQTTTVQVVPVSYSYEGIVNEPYQFEDAAVAVHKFTRRSQTIVAGGGGGAPVTDVSSYNFAVDGGMPMLFVLRTTSNTNVGGSEVRYQLTLVGRRTTSAVSPLLNDP